MESSKHHTQAVILEKSLERWWQARQDFFIGVNLTVYFSRQQLKNHDFRGPDVFIVLGVERNVFAELGGHPACGVLEGLFSVVLSHLAKRLVAVREVRCARLGAPSCDFVAVMPARVPALERVAQGLRTAPDAAIEAMIAEVHRGGS